MRQNRSAKTWSGKPVGRSSYFFIIHNPIYYGVIRYAGESYEGKHELIISKRLFDLAQSVSIRKARPKKGLLKHFIYRGVFRCGECGAAITNEIQRGHTYLRCTKRIGNCRQPYLREESATEQILAQLDRMTLPTDWPEKMLAELEHQQSEDARSIKALKSRILDDLNTCGQRLDTLLDLLLSGQISNPEYTAKKQTLVDQRTELREQLSNLDSTSLKRFEPLWRFVLALKEATILATERNPAACRDFLKIHGSNFRVSDRRVQIDLNKPWHLFADSHSTLSQTSNNQSLSVQNTSWLRVLDDVRTSLISISDLNWFRIVKTW